MHDLANNRSKGVLTLLVLAAFAIVAALVWITRPVQQDFQNAAGPRLSVETRIIEPGPYQVALRSYGTIQPKIQTMLVSQVSGQIVSVNPNVREGGFFEKGDVLATIDPRDYEANLEVAEASLMDAQQALADAEALTEQAREDWKNLGRTGEPPILVLRLPQLEAARARVKGAQAELRKAELELQRTDIVAPYAGRVLTKFVDIGQVVPENTNIAEIYSTETVEIRLPLRNRDLPFIDLPETWRYSDNSAAQTKPTTVRSELSGQAEWPARLVRTEGAIDATARQLHVIVEIDDPFGRENESQAPLKIGQYVTADVPGKHLPQAIVIPNHSIYQGSYVYLVRDDVLRRVTVNVAWQNDEDAIIDGGLEHGDELVLTPLGQVTSGVRISREGASQSGGGQINSVAAGDGTQQ